MINIIVSDTQVWYVRYKIPPLHTTCVFVATYVYTGLVLFIHRFGTSGFDSSWIPTKRTNLCLLKVTERVFWGLLGALPLKLAVQLQVAELGLSGLGTEVRRCPISISLPGPGSHWPTHSPPPLAPFCPPLFHLLLPSLSPCASLTRLALALGLRDLEARACLCVGQSLHMMVKKTSWRICNIWRPTPSTFGLHC